ncbi:SUKH-3 domain-containing protein [Hazenella coriacea]|uniref:SUKH-3 immunity protein of toxin-antitoxin system n=1 Tax=Hazenella coriacea TaxID=1179467 RepID=A0A4V2UVP8_9BACL|nr:SUKH-3 domain-containing protein [Hazenella coriacea]TCS96617.1 SUKH-3 immunity protein of toxin-antitoxin system [Hazenella coriacea]
MQTLTKEVENILAQSGWHIDRQVDITEIENFLKSKGYSLSPLVIKALQEFGGIEYTFRHPDESCPLY